MNHTDDISARPATRRSGRSLLTLGEFAQRLDHRLHFPHLQAADLAAGCRYATDNGLAAVTCLPERVPEVARHLRGTDVSIATALDVHEAGAVHVADAEWTSEACRLADQGATELAVVASAARLAGADRDSFLQRLNRLLTLQDVGRFRVRVHVDVHGLSDDQLRQVSHDFEEAGVWMVQAGAWTNQRSAFRSLLVMRAALGPDVLLKWTTPVPSYHVMLLAIAEGVDRFNGDVPALLRDFIRESRYGPVSVPRPGLDY